MTKKSNGLSNVRSNDGLARRHLKKMYDYFMGPHACGDFTCDCGSCGLCKFRAETKKVLTQLRIEC